MTIGYENFGPQCGDKMASEGHAEGRVSATVDLHTLRLGIPRRQQSRMQLYRMTDHLSLL